MLKRRHNYNWLYSLIAENSLANFGHYAIYAFLFLYLLNVVGLAPSMAAFMLSIFAVMVRMGRVLWAPLLDKLAAHTIIPLGLGLCAVGYLGLAYSSSPLAIGLCLVVVGTGYSANNFTVKLLLSLHTTQEFPAFLRYAYLNIYTNLVAATGPLIGNFLFIHYPRHGLCLFPAAIFALASLACVFLPKTLPELPAQPIWWQGIVSHFKSWKLFTPLMLASFGWFLYTQLFVAIPVFARGIHAEYIVGSVYVVNTLLVVFLSYPVSKLILKFEIDNITVAIIAFGIYAVGYTPVMLWHMSAAVYGTVIIWSLAEILLMPALWTLVAESTVHEQRTVGFGLNALAAGLGEALGNYVGGYLAAHSAVTGLWRFTWFPLAFVACSLVLISMLTCLTYRLTTGSSNHY